MPMKQTKHLLTLLLILPYNTSPAASSKLTSIASICTKQQKLLGSLGRSGARLGKSSFLQTKQTHGYRPMRTLNTSAAPNLFDRFQKSLTNATHGLYNRLNTLAFWSKSTTQPITLSAIRSEIHTAHEQDKQGKTILPSSTKEKIKYVLNEDSIKAEEFKQELFQELRSLKEQIDDLIEQEDWYKEHRAEKLWKTKLSLLENERFILTLIKQFIQSQGE